MPLLGRWRAGYVLAAIIILDDEARVPRFRFLADHVRDVDDRIHALATHVNVTVVIATLFFVRFAALVPALAFLGLVDGPGLFRIVVVFEERHHSDGSGCIVGANEKSQTGCPVWPCSDERTLNSVR